MAYLFLYFQQRRGRLVFEQGHSPIEGANVQLRNILPVPWTLQNGPFVRHKLRQGPPRLNCGVITSRLQYERSEKNRSFGGDGYVCIHRVGKRR